MMKLKSCGFEGLIQLKCCPDYKPVKKASEFGMTSGLTIKETTEEATTTTAAETTTTSTVATTTSTVAEATTLQLRQFDARDNLNYLNRFRDICGSILNVRIYGGFEVEEHKYPWAVALGYSSQLSRADEQFLCGGVLISDQVKIVIDCSLS